MLHLYVDADACPVKEETYRVARRCDLPVTVVANSWMRTPEDERWFTLRISPYRTVGDVIEGIVLTFTDVTDIKETEARLRQEREYAQSIVETVNEPLVVLGADLRLLSASRSFYEEFDVYVKGKSASGSRGD